MCDKLKNKSLRREVFLGSVVLNVPQHSFIDDMLDCFSTVHNPCFKHLLLTLVTYSTIRMNSERKNKDKGKISSTVHKYE